VAEARMEELREVKGLPENVANALFEAAKNMRR
jgi:hypothetical protein